LASGLTSKVLYFSLSILGEVSIILALMATCSLLQEYLVMREPYRCLIWYWLIGRRVEATYGREI
jgi:hypothetical protein